jgi:hypothetical protein
VPQILVSTAFAKLNLGSIATMNYSTIYVVIWIFFLICVVLLLFVFIRCVVYALPLRSSHGVGHEHCVHCEKW